MSMTDRLSDQEVALLLATRCSWQAQTLAELAQATEIRLDQASPVVCQLVKRGILEPYIDYDHSVRYMYQWNDTAQAVYAEIHRAQ
jgi:hypothetical protein